MKTEILVIAHILILFSISSRTHASLEHEIETDAKSEQRVSRHHYEKHLEKLKPAFGHHEGHKHKRGGEGLVDAPNRNRRKDEENGVEEHLWKRDLFGTLTGGISGTLVGGVSAIGQSITNVAGNNVVGDLGKSTTGIGKSLAGAIKFVLFTDKNPQLGHVINITTLKDSNYDKKREMTIVMHGFTPLGYYNKPEDNMISMFRIKDGLIKANVTNIIIVDWSTLPSDSTYISSSTSTATVADEISDFIIAAVKEKLTKYSWVHIIGHSLGAHASGITGMKVTEKTNEKVARIDGIDPAGPNFDISPSSYQLGPTNAEFPLGGDDLPGCENARRKRNFFTDPLTGAVTRNICNHVRCIDLYIEALGEPCDGERCVPKSFNGCQCSSTSTYEDFLHDKCKCDTGDEPSIGYYCPTTAKGIYYLKPNLKSTYSKYPDKKSHYDNYGAGS